MGTVFGREREFAVTDAFLRKAEERFGVLVLKGEAGIGKTTVWREVVRRAEERGIHVLSCRPAEAETKLALSAVCDLLEAVPEEAFVALPGPQQHALAVALLRVDPAPGAQPRTLATAVRSLLHGLSGERPLLIAVDDVQWLDATSANVLGFTLRRLAGGRVGWLLARRLPLSVRLAPDRLVEPELLTCATIGPLTLAALHHLFCERLERPLPRSALVRIHRASGGNPFYALEIARELVRAGPALGVSIPVPDDLRALLSRRLRRLPAATRDALVEAAALSEPSTALVDERALGPAEEADLVRIAPDGRLTFRHPLYASAVYESASRARRRATHARLANRVTDVEEGARHLALAVEGPSEPVATRLDEASRRAAHRGAPDAAAELAGMAVQLTPLRRIADQRRRRLAQAHYLITAGDAALTRDACERLVVELPAGGERAEALLLLADTREDDLDASLALAERALADAADDPVVGARAHDLVARILITCGELRHALTHFRAGVELAVQTDDRKLLALVIGHMAHTESLLGRYTPGLLERGLRIEREHGILPDYGPTFAAGLRAMYHDRLDEGRVLLGQVRQVAAEVGDETRLGYALMHLAELECRAGDLDAAESFADEAVERAQQVGLEHSEAGSLYIRALIEALRGDVGEARRLAVRGLELVRGRGIFFVQLESVLGFLALSLGDAVPAAEHLRPLPPLLERMGYGEPSVNRVLPNAIEALIRLGELDEARPLIERLEERGQSLDSPWSRSTGARCRALFLAANGDLDGALQAFARALAEHERMTGPFERGRTLLAKGVVERRIRRRARARESFEAALAIFAEIGAELWAEQARSELARLGLRRAAGDELTESERRVAQLAAQGLTNREVAAALYLSPKTVEANLIRIYRKLGIGSRAELGAHIATLART